MKWNEMEWLTRMRKIQFKIDYLVDIILKKKLRLVTQIQIGATKNIQIQLKLIFWIKFSNQI